MKPDTTIRLMVTPGEPAGIGPDLCVMLSKKVLPFEWVVIADPQLLIQRAKQLKVTLRLMEFDPKNAISTNVVGEIKIIPVKTDLRVFPGKLAKENARYVLKTIDKAVAYCQQNEYAGLVTGPVHKGIINQAGYSFSGHTEYVAALTKSKQPVMMLQTNDLKVALVTTHLPLHCVSKAITRNLLEQVIKVLHKDLVSRFNLVDPKILVCGLNPHAGENGYLGTEELDVISPVIDKLKQENMRLVGPLPADTVFTPMYLEQADVVLAMYHDQGLPVLKYKGFGSAVNVTLGLPIVRTSVDHGTALELAGTGEVNCSSLELAMHTANTLINNTRAGQHT